MSHAFYSSPQKFNMTNLKSPINDVVIIVYMACQPFRMSQIFMFLPLNTLVAGKDTYQSGIFKNDIVNTIRGEVPAVRTMLI